MSESFDQSRSFNPHEEPTRVEGVLDGANEELDKLAESGLPPINTESHAPIPPEAKSKMFHLIMSDLEHVYDYDFSAGQTFVGLTPEAVSRLSEMKQAVNTPKDPDGTHYLVMLGYLYQQTATHIATKLQIPFHEVMGYIDLYMQHETAERVSHDKLIERGKQLIANNIAHAKNLPQLFDALKLIGGVQTSRGEVMDANYIIYIIKGLQNRRPDAKISQITNSYGLRDKVQKFLGISDNNPSLN